jgi:RND family efflux transporter MFP subunit
VSRKLKLVLPVLIVLVGVLGSLALVRAKRPVETVRPAVPAPLVRVVVVRPRDVRLDVTAQGTVLPRTETTLAAEVAGRVVAVASGFEVGGFVARGDALVSLDGRAYELALRRAEARVVQARLRLVQQEAEGRLAAEEWRDLAAAGEADPLVLRQPQIAEARAALNAAEAEVEMARLDLEHCAVRAPFDGRVSRKEVDLGRYLTPGQPVATLAAIDYAEVRLPVADRELAYLDLPLAYRDGGRPAAGPEVALLARFAGRRHVWRGRIVRTEGELDLTSRMLHLVARVADPYGRSAAAGRPPLTVGLFVEAVVVGRTLAGAVVLPRPALRDGGRVLVVDGEDRLRWRPVEVVRVEGERAVLDGGLEPGERVCVSPFDVVVEGMRVRTVEEEGFNADAGDAPVPEEEEVVGAPLAGELAIGDREPSEPISPAPAAAAPATGRLLEVRLLAGGEGTEVRVRVRVVGEFSYSTFTLPSPERFVIDLAGVVEASPRSAVEVGGGPVERIRVAQFQAAPEPISRLVFELRSTAVPEIESDGEGLRIAFPPVAGSVGGDQHDDEEEEDDG